MAFLIKEEPKLQSTFKVIIQSQKPLHIGPTVLLKYKQNQCIALVESIDIGNNQILIDRFLKLRLGNPKDSQVEIEPIELECAKSVEVYIPSDWMDNNEGKDWVKKNLLDKPLSEGLETQIMSLTGAKPIIISKITPSPYAMLCKDTEIVFQSLEKAKEETIGITWDTIGGLGQTKERIRELVEYPILYPELVKYIGIEPPKGILLYGPPGTGKTLIAKALCNEINASFHLIQGPEIIGAFFGESEKKLREIFEKASKEATLKKPSIIMIDEIDSLVPKRESAKGELESRLVATFLTLMDGLKETKGVIVIGTTNRQNAIDPALRRPGRFEYELYIGIPDVQGRKEILEIHTGKLRKMPLDDEVNLQELAEKTHGFVGADLAFLCREAGRNAFRRIYLSKEDIVVEEEAVEGKPPLLVNILWRIKIEDIASPPTLNIEKFLESVKVTKEDFESALSSVVPSGMREVMIQIPRDVTWEKIGGLKDVKEIIKENIINSIKNPEVFKEMGIRPARGILLYGPPGTGKTLIAKAIANECGANFIAIKGPELRSKWFGESEEKIRFIFDTARRHAPCVVFLDEVDALMPSRGSDISGTTDSIVNQFLSEMDGVQSAEGVFLIGATNRAELIDEALLRPGRFDYKVYIPLPDSEAREEVFKIHLKKEVLGNDVNLKELVEKTDGFSGAEIAEICRLSGLKALREVDFKKANSIKMNHLLSSIDEILERKGEEEKVDELKEELKKLKLDIEIKNKIEKWDREKLRDRLEELKEFSPTYYVILAILILSGVTAYLISPKDFLSWGIPLCVMLISYIVWFLSKDAKSRAEKQLIKERLREMERKENINDESSLIEKEGA